MKDSLILSSSARLYFTGVIGAGVSVTILSVAQLYTRPTPHEWLVLAALATLTGSFTVRIPGVAARISVSDAFVFTAVLLFGPATATAVVALDCLVMTLWGKRSLLRSFFNLSATALGIWIASHVFYALAGNPASSRDLVLTSLLAPLFVLALLYFLINTLLVAIALGFERRTNPWTLWREHFLWFSLNYFGGVSVAALLVSYTRSIDLAAVSIILPLLVISYLTHRASLGRVQDAQRHVDQVNELYMSTIEALAMAVDAKDQITHGHIRRVQVYTVELAKRLGVSDDRQLKAIATAALLHDMGKLAIPEHILNKPAKLTAAEFERIKRHAEIGADLLSSVRFPYPVVPIVRHHHENWDGTGYPAGISGADIPLGARILSVVDCFDALTSDRPYRPRLSVDNAFEIIRERRAKMYDPLVVDTFVRAYTEIAPAANNAAQQAKSIIDAASLVSEKAVRAPLNHIRANAAEGVLLDAYAREIIDAQSIGAALQIASQCLRQLTPATVYALFECDNQSDALTCRCVSGDEHRLLDGLSIKLGERVTGWSAANHRSSMNSDASLDLAQIATFFKPPLRSTLTTPLSDRERLLGVLTGYAPREDAFNESHRYTFEQISLALVNRITSLRSHVPTNLVSFPVHKS
jgi:putative nucleotidyltransferase with HDIG domain